MFIYFYNMIYDLSKSILYSGPNVDEIIPGIWLGDYKCASNISFLKENNINFVMNCTNDMPFYKHLYDKYKLNIETYRIPVDDSLLERDFIIMEEYFKITIPLLIRKYIKHKQRILIHCHAGKQRSAIVVAALLKSLLDQNYIKIQEIPKTVCKTQQFYNIYYYLLAKRKRVFTYGLRINFEKSYKRYFRICN